MNGRLILFVSIVSVFGFLLSCQKEMTPTLPVLTSSEISSITDSTAMSGGVISDAGHADVIARGICWSLTENPTVADSKTADGIGGGSFTSKLSKLKYATTYHVRAYATNSVGTAYGNDLAFSTNAILPTVSTDSINTITHISAQCGGKVIVEGGTITARGVCWGTNQTPTIADSKTADGTGIGTFTSSLTGLINNTKYYVRAYATNSAGTGYGNVVSFVAGTVRDIEGNLYHSVKIGSQVWMVENLKSTKFNDGTAITNITQNSAWASAAVPAYCFYQNNVDNKNMYGALYNNYVTTNSKNVCPSGWHVSTNEELTALQTALGGSAASGAKMKTTTIWNLPGDNSSGFTAYPSGWRDDGTVDGDFHEQGLTFKCWSSTNWFGIIPVNSSAFYRDTNMPTNGYAIRCVKD